METVQSGIKKPEKGNSGFWRWLVVIVIVVVIVLGGLFLISKYSRFNVLGLSSNGDWQAVFLSNGQVYFGKVVKSSSKEIVVQDIYYLQVTQALQRSGQQQDAQDTQQSELSLVKLGNELHGPTDEMRINRDHVLFTEDLKNDSRVVEAITNYKQSQQ